jgi:hypothetical protein
MLCGAKSFPKARGSGLFIERRLERREVIRDRRRVQFLLAHYYTVLCNSVKQDVAADNRAGERRRAF